ncbi:ester cyclase [Pseudomonas seleniipraecipitans]|uniref:Ester cyclase n=1 Tax=Phytopseudomonas seleniipraecipitans TaxID=640205 RepID=A0ABY5J956_9GAMM|nr:ester cyclase [Pseudomonas seleniipraecipitans]UUD64591.1 ester cyclase [Pseudomonas seleniipraecipitans]
MHEHDLPAVYRAYINCLNRQDWPGLGEFVHDDVVHNGRRLGLSGYREMLERDFQDIPDLRFIVRLLTCEESMIASRLDFHCSPKGRFLDLPVNGRKVAFSENVFYAFCDGKIAEVWSVVDKAAIEVQLNSRS